MFTRLSDFQRIIILNTLDALGIGMIAIFIPIYLLELGYSIPVVITWILILHLSILIGAFLVVFLSNRIGLINCWYIRVFLLGLFLLCLSQLDGSNLLFLMPLAILNGLESAFFWVPFNI